MLEEELGLTSPIEFLAKFPASRETANEHTALYRALTDEPPVPDAGEIDCIEFREPGEIAAMVEREPERFAPPFRVLFGWYREFHGLPAGPDGD